MTIASVRVLIFALVALSLVDRTTAAVIPCFSCMRRPPVDQDAEAEVVGPLQQDALDLDDADETMSPDQPIDLPPVDLLQPEDDDEQDDIVDEQVDQNENREFAPEEPFNADDVETGVLDGNDNDDDDNVETEALNAPVDVNNVEEDAFDQAQIVRPIFPSFIDEKQNDDNDDDDEVVIEGDDVDDIIDVEKENFVRENENDDADEIIEQEALIQDIARNEDAAFDHQDQEIIDNEEGDIIDNKEEEQEGNEEDEIIIDNANDQEEDAINGDEEEKFDQAGNKPQLNQEEADLIQLGDDEAEENSVAAENGDMATVRERLGSLNLDAPTENKSDVIDHFGYAGIPKGTTADDLHSFAPKVDDEEIFEIEIPKSGEKLSLASNSFSKAA